VLEGWGGRWTTLWLVPDPALAFSFAAICSTTARSR
jgi:hypothetical protein